MSGGRVIEIRKNAKSVIRVQPSEWRGQARVDIRTFCRDESGNFVPTRQGLSLTEPQLGELIDALIEFYAAAGGRS